MFFTILLFTIAVIGLLLILISNMVYSKLFKREKRSVDSDIEMLVSKKLIPKDYYTKLPLSNIRITSRDGIVLNGYSIKSSNNNKGWLILCHGISSNHATLLSHVDFFINYGFNILLIDQRGHGKSGMAISTYGILEKHDISLWIKYIKDNFHSKSTIGLMGHSMGASTALMTAITDYKPDFIIAEAPFSNLKKLVEYNMKNKRLPYFPFGTFTNYICKIKNGFKFEDADVDAAIKNTAIPILLIHGTNDRLIPYDMSVALSNENNLPLYTIEDGKHLIFCNIDKSTEEYWNTIRDFLNSINI